MTLSHSNELHERWVGASFDQAKQIQMGSVPAPQTNITSDKVKELVAAPADENELLACYSLFLTMFPKYLNSHKSQSAWPLAHEQ